MKSVLKIIKCIKNVLKIFRKVKKLGEENILFGHELLSSLLIVLKIYLDLMFLEESSVFKLK